LVELVKGEDRWRQAMAAVAALRTGSGRQGTCHCLEANLPHPGARTGRSGIGEADDREFLLLDPNLVDEHGYRRIHALLRR